jgi:hypothetical protein
MAKNTLIKGLTNLYMHAKLQDSIKMLKRCSNLCLVFLKRFSNLLFGVAQTLLQEIIKKIGISQYFCSGLTIQDALRDNAFDGTKESLIQVKYDPLSVWGYIEVRLQKHKLIIGHCCKASLLLFNSGSRKVYMSRYEQNISNETGSYRARSSAGGTWCSLGSLSGNISANTFKSKHLFCW